MNNKYIGVVVACMVSCCLHIAAQEHPKREFRGVWLPTAWQSRYAENCTEENKSQIVELLDVLQATGINAVIFQVRPQADAFYPSQLEPWSRHLTGTAGEAPSPGWDPLQFIIKMSLLTINGLWRELRDLELKRDLLRLIPLPLRELLRKLWKRWKLQFRLTLKPNKKQINNHEGRGTIPSSLTYYHFERR